MAIGDRVAKNIADRVKKMSGAVDVGFMEEAKYPDGTPVAAVAFWNNYGTVHASEDADGVFTLNVTPARAFFSNMIEEEKPTWGPKLARQLKGNGGDAEKALGAMGADIQGALIQSIRDFQDPPNAPSTIKRKGFNKPLTDTEDMVNSATYRVIK